MIKIVYVITGLYTGGAEIMLYKMLSKINRERFNPVVVSLIDRGTLSDRIERLGIPVHTIGMKQGIPTFSTTLRLVQTIQNFKPDILQGWMYHGNLAAYFASLFLMKKTPIFWSIHFSIGSLSTEKWMTKTIIRLGASLSNFVNQSIFVSKNSKNQHQIIGYSTTKNCVIPNGFDISTFKPSHESKSKFRKELGLSEETILIGLFARYHPMKDHSNFLKAANLLCKEFPQIHFVLAGKNVDRQNQSLQDLIRNLEIVSQVHLLGERNDIPYIASALDILTLASAYGEAFPMVIGEAMSSGVPCAVTDVGDSAWVVGDTGKVVPPCNPEALAIAWKELIALEPEGRIALGKLARERIEKLFALEQVTANYEKLYENVLNEMIA